MMKSKSSTIESPELRMRRAMFDMIPKTLHDDDYWMKNQKRLGSFRVLSNCNYKVQEEEKNDNIH